MKKGIRVIFSIIFLLIASPYLQAEENGMTKNRVLWKSMSQQEKVRIIEIYRVWKTQPAESRRKIQQNYKTYHNLSREERQKLKSRYNEYKRLDELHRKLIRERVKKMDQMFEDRRNMILERYGNMQKKPREEQIKMIEKSLFWKRLNEREREIFKKLLFPQQENNRTP